LSATLPKRTLEKLCRAAKTAPQQSLKMNSKDWFQNLSSRGLNAGSRDIELDSGFRRNDKNWPEIAFCQDLVGVCYCELRKQALIPDESAAICDPSRSPGLAPTLFLPDVDMPLGALILMLILFSGSLLF
jgi:hypothetical protein